MNEKTLLALYGLKYNPFLPNIPVEDLWMPPDIELFLSRIEGTLPIGGFILLEGAPGRGKSKLLHMLATRLEPLSDVVVGVMKRPQSSLGDFYRELGDLFGVPLSLSNRYGGFKALRSRWRDHIKSTLFRPVLIIDEGQEVLTECLNEIRLLGSVNFDSECILTTVIGGDERLPERFRTRELTPLGSRIRIRKSLEPYTHEELLDFLEHILEQAGAPHLMSNELKRTLCEHSAGNLRVLTNMSAELLEAGARRDLPSLDEKLFLEIFSKHLKQRRKR